MAYGLKYIIPFKTISEVSCEVRIEVKDYTGQVIELIGGANPFRIPTDESDLLVPIRPSSATLSVFGSDYLRDLYTSDPQGVRITQLTGGNVHWMGFLTPDTFSQNFTNPEFTYEMECVCALSTLKYRKFDFTDDFVSFAQIVGRAREYAGYSDVIYTNSVRLKSGSYFSARIASANFYDELGDPMTYYEVLEEIAKYAGCTWEPYEDILYFKDSAAIRSGYISYTKLSGGVVNLQDLKNVTNYKGTGTKISRIAGKNKAVVNCSLYEIENTVLELNEDESVFSEMYKEEIRLERKNSSGGKDYGTKHVLLRTFDQPKYSFYRYRPNSAGDALVLYDVTSEASTLLDTGSGFARRADYETWWGTPPPSSLSFSNEVMVRSFSIPGTDGRLIMNHNHPVITLESRQKILSVPGAYLAISFKFMPLLDNWYIDKPKIKAEGSMEVTMKLRIGNLYWNKTAWTTTESTFSIQIPVDGQLVGNYHSIYDQNTFDLGIPGVSGYLVPTPPNIAMGIVALTIFHIDSVNLLIRMLTGQWSRFSYYKDITVIYAIPDEQAIYGDWVDKDSKNDLIYENVIEGDYIEEADEIDLKICTNPDGKLALSSVMEGNNFLEEIETDVYGTGKAEEILIQRVIDMYETPRFVIDPTLANNAKPWTKFTEPHLNKQFLVAGGEEDVKMERTRYNLIEL